MNQLNQHIEALIFCSEQSLGLDEIAASLKLSYGWELQNEELLEAIESIRLKYAGEEFPFQLEEISGGFLFLTKKAFHPTVNALIQHKAKKKLSVAQMETLSIIAYKQPISKSEVEHIRGVNCDYAVQKLLEKELISISGKSEGPGRPILYSTSESFMDYFGIKSVHDLPQLKDIHVESNEIGQPAEYMDTSEMAATVELATDETTTTDVEILEPLTENQEAGEREILSHEITGETETHFVEESEVELPNRKQIYLEHQDNVHSDDQVDQTTDDLGLSGS
jgi:segregation and condensation protein B